MHFDGSKVKDGLGAGVVLTSPQGKKFKYVLQIHFAASNNVAEYEALIHGINVAKEIGMRRVACFGDSDLVVQQSSRDLGSLVIKSIPISSHFHSGIFKG